MKQKINWNMESIEMDMAGCTRNEALRILGQKLERQGFVKREYYKDLIKREEEYPTALRFPHINIAIAHSSPKDVFQSAIVVGKCSTPVAFHNMEKPEETIDVNVIFVLALKDSNEHIDMLSNLMEMFSDEHICRAIMETSSREEMYSLISSCLFALDMRS